MRIHLLYRSICQSVAFLLASGAALAATTLLESETLQLELDGRGKLVALRDRAEGTDYLLGQKTHWKASESIADGLALDSYLLRIKKWGETAELNPKMLKVRSIAGGKHELVLSYTDAIEATVTVIEKERYITFELTGMTSVEQVDKVFWGPYYTSIDLRVGQWLGLVRNEDFALCMQSLTPNTHAAPYRDMTESVASYNEGDCVGTNLSLQAWDHSQKRAVKAYFAPLSVESDPIEGFTVVGSKMALMGTGPSDDNVLDAIEVLELSEGLPHPVLDGVWSKRQPKASASTLMTEKATMENINEYVDVAVQGGFPFVYINELWSTWGHFLINPKIFPNRMEDLKATVARSKDKGVIVGAHFLTAFLRSHGRGDDEPYLVNPDQRLAKFIGESGLAEDLSVDADTILLTENPGDFLRIYNKNMPSYVRINDEIIEYAALEQNPLRLTGCVRGQWGSSASTHQSDDEVVRLCFAVYENFYPGTPEMLEEMARNVGRVFRESGMEIMSFDGHESADVISMGQYGMELFVDSFFDEIGGYIYNQSSRCNNYYWHTNSYLSWGEPWEYIRYPSLHYRFFRLEQIAENLQPKKMGQVMLRVGGEVHTDKKLMEYWLARGAGYDAGFDFYVELNRLKQLGSAGDEMLETIKTWEDARMQGFFTERQKLELRQADTEWTLERKGNSFELIEVGKAVNSHEDKLVAKVDSMCSIDRTWFHDLDQYSKLWIGKDHKFVGTAMSHEVNWQLEPKSVTEWMGEPLQFVLRVDPKGSSGIRNPYFETAQGWVRAQVDVLPGQYLVANKPKESKTLLLYGADRKIIREVACTRAIPYLKSGDTTVTFGYESIGSRPPAVLCNFRYTNHTKEK